eukprot:TRINITY_DN1617_c0_g1_i1.p1 TRINITY_DN1617_c0_g1~~TRINITY_DN1617_c0_g1_i1.p1  ORF type:complete len:972 (+),score=111.72 TRINITY_DN1617_c0_g1_i1:10640-13555(+)
MMVKGNDLEFDSEFEQGNLDLVLKQKTGEYDLFMRTDSNTRGHHQWFYFSVKNKQPGTYKFNILNFTKSDSLYNHGMRIAMFSKKKSALAKKGELPAVFSEWHRGGDNISYKISKLSSENGTKSKSLCLQWISTIRKKTYYSLSFEYTFEYPDDFVYFAYSIPYTFTELVSLLSKLKEEQSALKSNIHYKEEILCKSLSGLDIPLLTITSVNSTKQEHCEPELPAIEDLQSNDLEGYVAQLRKIARENRSPKKSVVIITARIHPGETCGSFMMQGFLRYIISSDPVAISLRNKIIFKIVPMMNPDGVVVGNYRACLSGQDLNRKFSSPDPRLHPEICAIKRLLYELRSQGQKILGYFDLHAHSKKKCVFIYGPYYPLHSTRYLKVRVFAKLIAANTQMFRYKACKYRQEQEKMCAARLVISREFDIMNSFTIEASFYGFINEDRKTVEFGQQFYEVMGKYIAESLSDYADMLEEERINRLQRVYLKRYKKRKKQHGSKKLSEKYQPKDLKPEPPLKLEPVKKKEPSEEVTKKPHHKVIRVEDSYKNPDLFKQKAKKNLKLNDIYESIQEDIEREKESDQDSGSNDSDSAESEGDPLSKEEEAKAIKCILETLEGYSKSEGNTPKQSSEQSKNYNSKSKKRSKRRNAPEMLIKGNKVQINEDEKEATATMKKRVEPQAKAKHTKLYEEYMKKYYKKEEPLLKTSEVPGTNIVLHKNEAKNSLVPLSANRNPKQEQYSTSASYIVATRKPKIRRAPTPIQSMNMTDDCCFPIAMRVERKDNRKIIMVEETRNDLKGALSAKPYQNSGKVPARNVPANINKLCPVKKTGKNNEVLKFLHNALQRTKEETTTYSGFIPTQRIRRTSHSSSIKSRAKCAERLRANRILPDGTQNFGLAYNLVYLENNGPDYLDKRSVTATRPRMMEDFRKLAILRERAPKYDHGPIQCNIYLQLLLCLSYVQLAMIGNDNNKNQSK